MTLNKKIVALAAAMALTTLLDSGLALAGALDDSGASLAEGRVEVVRGDLEAGLAAIKGRDWPLARVYLQRAVDRDPQDPDALAAMGEVYLRLGDRATARQYTEAALIVEPEHRRALATMGEIYLLSGNMPEARRKAEQLAELCPRGCVERSRLQEAIAARAPGGS
ncbi:MAG TPA: tetratricopeptide repeat protein [Alphaproteobacteria bacterium]|jgi:Tfp pilus assembly protein PilF|nr:tetratricopeptide repeat protein [Alphaproteobacteria bacterium]